MRSLSTTTQPSPSFSRKVSSRAARYGSTTFQCRTSTFTSTPKMKSSRQQAASENEVNTGYCTHTLTHSSKCVSVCVG